MKQRSDYLMAVSLLGKMGTVRKYSIRFFFFDLALVAVGFVGVLRVFEMVSRLTILPQNKLGQRAHLDKSIPCKLAQN